MFCIAVTRNAEMFPELEKITSDPTKMVEMLVAGTKGSTLVAIQASDVFWLRAMFGTSLLLTVIERSIPESAKA
jgi:hypothetical protein